MSSSTDSIHKLSNLYVWRNGNKFIQGLIDFMAKKQSNSKIIDYNPLRGYATYDNRPFELFMLCYAEYTRFHTSIILNDVTEYKNAIRNISRLVMEEDRLYTIIKNTNVQEEIKTCIDMIQQIIDSKFDSTLRNHNSNVPVIEQLITLIALWSISKYNIETNKKSGYSAKYDIDIINLRSYIQTNDEKNVITQIMTGIEFDKSKTQFESCLISRGVNVTDASYVINSYKSSINIIKDMNIFNSAYEEYHNLDQKSRLSKALSSIKIKIHKK